MIERIQESVKTERLKEIEVADWLLKNGIQDREKVVSVKTEGPEVRDEGLKEDLSS